MIYFFLENLFNIVPVNFGFWNCFFERTGSGSASRSRIKIRFQKVNIMWIHACQDPNTVTYLATKKFLPGTDCVFPRRAAKDSGHRDRWPPQPQWLSQRWQCPGAWRGRDCSVYHCDTGWWRPAGSRTRPTGRARDRGGSLLFVKRVPVCTRSGCTRWRPGPRPSHQRPLRGPIELTWWHR